MNNMASFNFVANLGALNVKYFVGEVQLLYVGPLASKILHLIHMCCLSRLIHSVAGTFLALTGISQSRIKRRKKCNYDKQ